jgi:hypothetical protein
VRSKIAPLKKLEGKVKQKQKTNNIEQWLPQVGNKWQCYLLQNEIGQIELFFPIEVVAMARRKEY